MRVTSPSCEEEWGAALQAIAAPPEFHSMRAMHTRTPPRRATSAGSLSELSPLSLRCGDLATRRSAKGGRMPGCYMSRWRAQITIVPCRRGPFFTFRLNSVSRQCVAMVGNCGCSKDIPHVSVGENSLCLLTLAIDDDAMTRGRCLASHLSSQFCRQEPLGLRSK